MTRLQSDRLDDCLPWRGASEPGSHRKEICMNARFRILLACIGVVLCALAGSALTQSHAKAPTPEVLSTLKAGKWIQLEGSPQKDGYMLCTEVKLLTGDFL